MSRSNRGISRYIDREQEIEDSTEHVAVDKGRVGISKLDSDGARLGRPYSARRQAVDVARASNKYLRRLQTRTFHGSGQCGNDAIIDLGHAAGAELNPIWTRG